MVMRGAVTVAARHSATRGVEAYGSVARAGAEQVLSVFGRGQEQSFWPDLPVSIVTTRVPYCTAGIQQIVITPLQCNLHHHAVALGYDSYHLKVT